MCEWPQAGVPLSRAEIDADEVLAAAGRARVVFDFPDPPPDHGWML